MLLGKKFTCPFCIREYPTSKVKYVCTDCGTAATVGAFVHEPVKCRARFAKDPKNPMETVECGGYATKRVCPFCDNTIPNMALETPNLPFSIVGVTNSGKTNYITVMLHELLRSSGLKLALGHQTQETLNNQNMNADLIFQQHTIPDNTASTPDGMIMPQIWYIRNLEKKHGNTVPTYTFTIFDGAGEDHERMDPTECRYIKASRAIIIALDPLVLPGVRKGGQVDQDVILNSLNGADVGPKNSEDIVNGLATYIKSARGIKASKTLDIPVAIVLTKFDALLQHPAFGPQALIKKRSLAIRNGVISLSEIQQVDAEIRNWLTEIGEQSFITALESQFSDFVFFGVSSYGAPPKGIGLLPDEIKPHRVLDPILWLFKKAKFID